MEKSIININVNESVNDKLLGIYNPNIDIELDFLNYINEIFVLNYLFEKA